MKNLTSIQITATRVALADLDDAAIETCEAAVANLFALLGWDNLDAEDVEAFVADAREVFTSEDESIGGIYLDADPYGPGYLPPVWSMLDHEAWRQSQRA